MTTDKLYATDVQEALTNLAKKQVATLKGGLRQLIQLVKLEAEKANGQEKENLSTLRQELVYIVTQHPHYDPQLKDILYSDRYQKIEEPFQRFFNEMERTITGLRPELKTKLTCWFLHFEENFGFLARENVRLAYVEGQDLFLVQKEWGTLPAGTCVLNLSGLLEKGIDPKLRDQIPERHRILVEKIYDQALGKRKNFPVAELREELERVIKRRGEEDKVEIC